MWYNLGMSTQDEQSYVSSALGLVKNDDNLVSILARGFADESRFTEVAIYDTSLDHDNQSDWKVIEFGNLGEYATQLANLDTAIFAGTNQGNIYKSDDFGETWYLVSSGLLDNCTRVYGSDAIKVVYASSCDEVIRSLDNGETWETLSDIFGELTDVNKENS